MIFLKRWIGYTKITFRAFHIPVSPSVAGLAYKFYVGAVNRVCGERLLLSKPSHPLPRIRHFREAGVSIFPEGEELLPCMDKAGNNECFRQAQKGNSFQ